MLIRMATTADTDGICRLWAGAGVGCGPEVDRSEIAERLRRDPSLFIVAEEEGRLVGSVMGCYDGHRGWLKRVAVAADRQGAGVGRRMVEEIERRFLGLGITKLRLSVAADNQEALGFWSHLGYEDSGQIRHHERELDGGRPGFGSLRPWPTAWPSDWADRVAGAGCPMCASLGADHPSSLLLASTGVADIRLDRHSRFPGYCVIVWNRGHASDLIDLDEADATRFMADVRRVGRALQTAFAPVKLNYLTLGNTVPHLHTHVVPRYGDDPAAGGPVPWELVRSELPCDEAELDRQAARIRAALEP